MPMCNADRNALTPIPIAEHAAHSARAAPTDTAPEGSGRRGRFTRSMSRSHTSLTAFAPAPTRAALSIARAEPPGVRAGKGFGPRREHAAERDAGEEHRHVERAGKPAQTAEPRAPRRECLWRDLHPSLRSPVGRAGA